MWREHLSSLTLFSSPLSSQKSTFQLQLSAVMSRTAAPKRFSVFRFLVWHAKKLEARGAEFAVANFLQYGKIFLRGHFDATL